MLQEHYASSTPVHQLQRLRRQPHIGTDLFQENDSDPCLKFGQLLRNGRGPDAQHAGMWLRYCHAVLVPQKCKALDIKHGTSLARLEVRRQRFNHSVLLKSTNKVCPLHLRSCALSHSTVGDALPESVISGPNLSNRPATHIAPFSATESKTRCSKKSAHCRTARNVCLGRKGSTT